MTRSLSRNPSVASIHEDPADGDDDSESKEDFEELKRWLACPELPVPSPRPSRTAATPQPAPEPLLERKPHIDPCTPSATPPAEHQECAKCRRAVCPLNVINGSCMFIQRLVAGRSPNISARYLRQAGCREEEDCFEEAYARYLDNSWIWKVGFIYPAPHVPTNPSDKADTCQRSSRVASGRCSPGRREAYWQQARLSL